MPSLELLGLREGSTPLLASRWLSRAVGARVWLKDESRNPTGSYTDRIASLAVSRARALGYGGVIAASDGNLGASIAAYAAAAGLRAVVVVPKRADPGKVAQAAVYGADIIVEGEVLDDSVRAAALLSKRKGLYNATAELPGTDAMITLKGISYEVFGQLGRVPDAVVVPTASGSTALALHLGWKALVEHGVAARIPKLVLVQVPPYAKIAEKLGASVPSEAGEPIAGLSYRDPPKLEQVVNAVRESGGTSVVVSSRDVYAAALELARKEGLLAEPAAAAAVAGLLHLRSEGLVRGDVVVLITGSGLKVLEAYTALTKQRGVPMPTKLKILKIIASHGTVHGYRIWKELGTVTSPQAIYQHLRDLESKRLIERVKCLDSRRIMYKLTDRGAKLLSALNEVGVF